MNPFSNCSHWFPTIKSSFGRNIGSQRSLSEKSSASSVSSSRFRNTIGADVAILTAPDPPMASLVAPLRRGPARILNAAALADGNCRCSAALRRGRPNLCRSSSTVSGFMGSEDFSLDEPALSLRWNNVARAIVRQCATHDEQEHCQTMGNDLRPSGRAGKGTGSRELVKIHFQNPQDLLYCTVAGSGGETDALLLVETQSVSRYRLPGKWHFALWA